MDLDLTPEQELLRETVRGLCARHCGLDVVRQMEDDPIGYPDKLWLQFGELGLLDMSELSPVDAVIVYEELGRALAPSPHFVSSVMAGGVLSRVGETDWLPRIASGDAIVSTAWLEPDRGFGPAGVQATYDGSTSRTPRISNISVSASPGSRSTCTPVAAEISATGRPASPAI